MGIPNGDDSRQGNEMSDRGRLAWKPDWLGFKVLVKAFLFFNDDVVEAEEMGGVAELSRIVDMPFPPSVGLKLTDERDSLDLVVTEIQAYGVAERPEGRLAGFLCWANMEGGYSKALEARGMLATRKRTTDAIKFEAVVEFLRERGWTAEIYNLPDETSSYG